MRPAVWNPRTISEFQMRALKESMTTYGVVEPVVLNADGTILGGHQRYDAALELGWTYLAAVRVDLPDREARLLNLALNRVGGEFDENALARIIAQVTDEPVELLVAGFDLHEVERLLAGLDAPVGPGEFPSPNTDTDHRCPSCHYEWSGPCQ